MDCGDDDTASFITKRISILFDILDAWEKIPQDLSIDKIDVKTCYLDIQGNRLVVDVLCHISLVAYSMANPVYIYIYISYLPNLSARAGYDTRSIFKRSLTGLNSEFSFS